MTDNKSYLYNSMSELESLCLETQTKWTDSYEVGSLVDNLKQMLFVEHKSMSVFTDWELDADYSIFDWISVLDDYLPKLLGRFKSWLDCNPKLFWYRQIIANLADSNAQRFVTAGGTSTSPRQPSAVFDWVTNKVIYEWNCT